MSPSKSSIISILNSKTPILGLKLYVVIALSSISLLLLLSLLCVCLRRRPKRTLLPHQDHVERGIKREKGRPDVQISSGLLASSLENFYKRAKKQQQDVQISSGSIQSSSQVSSSIETTSSSGVGSINGGENIGWGRWYSVKELEIATRGFAEECEIGRGGYGVVYKGVLPDGSVMAVKNLIDNKGQAEKEFKVEVEAIGKVRHKNLVGLIGFCAEGTKRLLVYEYVDNGNLEQWLHGEVGPISPLTWDIRMKIAVGTAKGLAYLHEGLEPKVVHRDVKSSNILLDRKWNAKVSDFGLAKLLGPEKSYVTTRVMGTFGYVSPEYASTGMLNEGSDVYSFGILLMELITGRTPVDYSKAPGEMNLVDWFKSMVSRRRGEDVLDPLIQVAPSPRALKRVLLICLRCIDMDTNKRPKMGQIVHMLEADEFPFRPEPRSPKETVPLRSHDSISKNDLLSRKGIIGR